MSILICILKTILGYLILMFVGTNLLGLVARGIIPSYKIDETGVRVRSENITSNKSIIMTIIFAIITLLYFYALYYYWNIGVVIAAAMLMFTRLPDLLFEMKTGEKVNSKNMPKKPIDVFCTVFYWAALPVLWYSLCYIK